jgi:large subunit ribosomal protein L18
MKSDLKRKNRVRKNLKIVNPGKPRLTVFRSLNNIYVQVIDDLKNSTLASASSREKNFPKLNKIKMSELVGKNIAERCLKLGLKEVYLDRGKYKYHGRIKELAESAKKEGLKI